MSATKAYLGDGVYVDVCQLGILLTTENGITATNTIILEPKIFRALLAWEQRLRRPPVPNLAVAQALLEKHPTAEFRENE